jgi:GNAT superfamily N-acetyltransferase
MSTGLITYEFMEHLVMWVPLSTNLNTLKKLSSLVLTIHKPEYRGYGIARSLLEECISDCKGLGVGRIWLHSSQEGYQLYKKMGFTDKDSEMELLL